MKANELRIGNWVLYDETVFTHGLAKGEFQVAADTLFSMGVNSDYADMINPILLSEEWLERFGFVKEDRKPLTALHGPYFSKYADESIYSFAFAEFREDYGLYIEYTDSPFPEDQGRKYIVSVGFKYVHQLQNLYFSITGEELELKK